MTTESNAQLRQRAEYTHKFNLNTGRHGWLRLTPAYSVKVVEEIVERYGDTLSILDPFCGTGTTALSAINHGHVAATTDINPFLIWLASAKTAHYTAADIAQAEALGKAALDLVRREAIMPFSEPPIHNIERWWGTRARKFLCYLKAAIRELAGQSGPVSDLLNITFCRTLIKLSNAAFNHQSMSFKINNQTNIDFESNGCSSFMNDLSFVIIGAKQNPSAVASVILGDARELPACVDSRFDVVVTSPPYANRMSYIRELRPYMYWLDYLIDARDAAELDWLAIGGTWGVATSRLVDWSSCGTRRIPGEIQFAINSIARSDNANGKLLANYVAKYFDDMSVHFDNLRRVLNPGARAHYIVGNSTFYGILVSTEQVYAAMFREYGFTDVAVRPIRKRNSKKELIEFDVSAKWPGA